MQQGVVKRLKSDNPSHWGFDGLPESAGLCIRFRSISLNDLRIKNYYMDTFRSTNVESAYFNYHAHFSKPEEC